jgi:hypothetical protein
MNFIPDKPSTPADVPYFDDIESDAGWKGQTTGKSIQTLKSEIVAALGRLGGNIHTFRTGMYVVNGKERRAFQIEFTIEAPDGRQVPGILDVAALPVRPKMRYRRNSSTTKEEQSMRMALFMIRDALDGLWFLNVLSPGYAPLMPFALVDGEMTVSRMWNESSNMRRLAPPSGSDFILDAEVKP